MPCMHNLKRIACNIFIVQSSVFIAHDWISIQPALSSKVRPSINAKRDIG